jgi:hypothetical protein
MANDKIPQKINLSVSDPFIKYLGYMYNSGIDYLHQAREILNSMDDYKTKLNDYMKNNRLKFLLDEEK